MFGLGLVCYDYVSRFALVHYVARDAQPSYHHMLFAAFF
jgi:hypothetical protein